MWTVIVPINYGRECKTRLASRLTLEQREKLVESMARHVLDTLASTPAIHTIRVLSAVRPPFVEQRWIKDQGRGLNAELEAARAELSRKPLAFIHADLPFLEVGDVENLLNAATRAGAAIAPDRHEQGTNALAIADDRHFCPAFGPDSFARHKAALPDAAVVSTPGLSFDIDEPECLDLAVAKGLLIPA